MSVFDDLHMVAIQLSLPKPDLDLIIFTQTLAGVAKIGYSLFLIVVEDTGTNDETESFASYHGRIGKKLATPKLCPFSSHHHMCCCLATNPVPCMRFLGVSRAVISSCAEPILSLSFVY